MPNAGDVAWVEFDSPVGTEQAGRRPVLILTSEVYHQRTRRALVCPITRNTKAWPFNILIPAGFAVEGAIMVDQVRMIDRDRRLFDCFETMPAVIVAEVRGRLATLMGLAPDV